MPVFRVDEGVGRAVANFAAPLREPLPEVVEYLLWRGLAAVAAWAAPGGRPRKKLRRRRAGHSRNIRAYLREEYPGGVLPRGTQVDIANSFGVSKTLVNQLVSGLGYSVLPHESADARAREFAHTPRNTEGGLR